MRSALLDSTSECYSSSDDTIADDALKELSTNQKYDIVTVVLNCDRSLNIQEPTWKEMEDDNSFNFEVYPLAMKACITSSCFTDVPLMSLVPTSGTSNNLLVSTTFILFWGYYIHLVSTYSTIWSFYDPIWVLVWSQEG